MTPDLSQYADAPTDTTPTDSPDAGYFSSDSTTDTSPSPSLSDTSSSPTTIDPATVNGNLNSIMGGLVNNPIPTPTDPDSSKFLDANKSAITQNSIPAATKYPSVNNFFHNTEYMNEQRAAMSKMALMGASPEYIKNYLDQAQAKADAILPALKPEPQDPALLSSTNKALMGLQETSALENTVKNGDGSAVPLPQGVANLWGKVNPDMNKFLVQANSMLKNAVSEVGAQTLNRYDANFVTSLIPSASSTDAIKMGTLNLMQLALSRNALMSQQNKPANQAPINPIIQTQLEQYLLHAEHGLYSTEKVATPSGQTLPLFDVPINYAGQKTTLWDAYQHARLNGTADANQIWNIHDFANLYNKTKNP